jgi:tripartite ATP-independent transporter DctP family solute receptor
MRLRPFQLWFLLPVLLLGYAAWRGAAGANTEVEVIRLAHALNTDHPVHKGMEVFAREVAERSGGRLRIDIYPDGRLGNERELVELLQIGSIGITKVSAGQLEAFAPVFAVFGLPYLFDDTAHFWRFAESAQGRALLDAARAQRIKGLTWYDAGARSFYLRRGSARAVRHPRDLEGLAVRVMPSRTAMAMVEALGAKPVPIPFGELYTALDAGIVDAAENNPPSLFTSRQYEVAQSYSLNTHMILPDVLVIGTSTWERLDAAQRAWLESAAEVSAAAQREIWQREEESSLAAMRRAGLEIVTDIDHAAFRQATRGVYDTEAFQSSEASALIDAIRAQTR